MQLQLSCQLGEHRVPAVPGDGVHEDGAEHHRLRQPAGDLLRRVQAESGGGGGEEAPRPQRPLRQPRQDARHPAAGGHTTTRAANES